VSYPKLIIIKVRSFLKMPVFPIKLVAIRNLTDCSRTYYDGLPGRNSPLNIHHSLQFQLIVNFQIIQLTNYLSMLIIIHFTGFHHTFLVLNLIVL